MFGRGIYFADMSTKSSQYSVSRFNRSRANKHRTAFLILCDVSLGRICKFESRAHVTQPPVGHDSVMGVAGNGLLHNEYVIYNPRQHRITHLIEFSA